MSQAQSQTDVQRKNDLLADLQRVRSQVEDGLMMGDSMFGRFAHAEVAHEVKNRTEELQKKKNELEQELKEKEAIIQRANRDFSDVKDALPETLERQRVQFVEDYTLLFLTLSYVFMVISAVIFYVTVSEQKIAALAKGLGYSVVATLMAGLLLYFIA
jgi:chromosome segregation ATPase